MELFKGIEDRITALETENKTLKAEIAQLKGLQGRKVIPAPPEPETNIYRPVEIVRADSPNEKELQALRGICRRQYPKFCDSDDFVWSRPPDREACEREWIHQFGRSILALSGMKTLEKPDVRRYSVGSHIDIARELLMRVGKRTSEIRASVFCLACFCMNVPVSGVGVPESVISIGLSMKVGKPIAPDAWRSVLTAGKLPRQFAVERVTSPHH